MKTLDFIFQLRYNNSNVIYTQNQEKCCFSFY